MRGTLWEAGTEQGGPQGGLRPGTAKRPLDRAPALQEALLDLSHCHSLQGAAQLSCPWAPAFCFPVALSLLGSLSILARGRDLEKPPISYQSLSFPSSAVHREAWRRIRLQRTELGSWLKGWRGALASKSSGNRLAGME